MWCDLDEELIEMLLHQTQHLYMKYAVSHSAMKTEILHGGQAGILFVLKFDGGKSQKELADMLHLSAPSVTSAIKKLESEGYVVRKQDEKDQRIMRLSNTKKGDAIVESIIEAGKSAEAVAMKNISEEEEKMLRKVLKQMIDNLSEGKD